MEFMELKKPIVLKSFTIVIYFFQGEEINSIFRKGLIRKNIDLKNIKETPTKNKIDML